MPMECESRSTVFGHRQDWLLPGCGESGRTGTRYNPISGTAIGTEGVNITVLGGGNGEIPAYRKRFNRRACLLVIQLEAKRTDCGTPRTVLPAERAMYSGYDWPIGRQPEMTRHCRALR